MRWFVLIALLSVPSSSALAQQPGLIELDRISNPAVLEQRIRAVLRPEGGSSGITVPNGAVHAGPFALAAGQRVLGHQLVLRGDADLAGTVAGNIVVLDGNLLLRSGGSVTGDALVIGGRVLDQGGTVAGEVRAVRGTRTAGATPAQPVNLLTRLTGLVGVLLALLLAGFGLVTFGRARLEIISDTVARSFFRSFLIGILAQIVALPTAGLLILGLVLSVVGILLLPFVALVVPLLILTALLTGFLAALHAMGEARVRRRLAAGEFAGSPNSYRYLLLGLGGFSLIWLAWALFGGVPLAGTLVLLVAVSISWIALTAGLGAFLLSRAGLRGEAAGRLIPPEALTDEYLWATPRFGVTAARRPPRT